MLVGAPHGIHELVALRDNAQRFVSILAHLGRKIPEGCSFDDATSPVFDVDVLVFWWVSGLGLGGHGHGDSVKVFVEGDSRELEQRGDNVGVGCRQRDLGSRRDARTADGKGDVDVFFDVAGLAGGEAVVANVVAVVAGVDDIGVCEDIGVGFEGGDDVVDDFVDGLESL